MTPHTRIEASNSPLLRLLSLTPSRGPCPCHSIFRSFPLVIGGPRTHAMSSKLTEPVQCRFVVLGSTGAHYKVVFTKDKEKRGFGAGNSRCECMDYRLRRHTCKHIKYAANLVAPSLCCSLVLRITVS